MIKRPTRYGEFSATLIDNIFTNITSADLSLVSGIILDDFSDHLPVFLAINSLQQQTSKRVAKTFRKINDTTLLKLSERLQNTDWSELDNLDPNAAYETFCKQFDDAYNASLPIESKQYKIHLNKHKPWISTGILNSVKRKHHLYKRYLSTKLQVHKTAYIRYKNKLTKVIRIAEKRYYFHKFNYAKNNVRDTWKLINVLNDSVGKDNKSTVHKINSNRGIVDNQEKLQIHSMNILLI